LEPEFTTPPGTFGHLPPSFSLVFFNS
jgi:hypothetical protein